MKSRASWNGLRQRWGAAPSNVWSTGAVLTRTMPREWQATPEQRATFKRVFGSLKGTLSSFAPSELTGATSSFANSGLTGVCAERSGTQKQNLKEDDSNGITKAVTSDLLKSKVLNTAISTDQLEASQLPILPDTHLRRSAQPCSVYSPPPPRAHPRLTLTRPLPTSIPQSRAASDPACASRAPNRRSCGARAPRRAPPSPGPQQQRLERLGRQPAKECASSW
eukprot:2077395-Rhodomonas_salina.2